MTSRQDLADGEQKIEQFLTHLAVNKNIAPATQNQAMNALVLLSKKVLKVSLNDEINAERASKKLNIPVVMYGYTNDSGITGTQGCCNHHDLHSCSATGRAWCRKSFGGFMKIVVFSVSWCRIRTTPL